MKSRYYDPVICRWISADNVISGIGGDVRGNNLFAYCFNNPVNMDDAGGQFPQRLKNAIKWVVNSIAEPVVKKAEEFLSKHDATLSAGIALNGTPSIVMFGLQGGVSVDTKGNVALQGCWGGGFTAGSPGASGTIYAGITNAPSIDHLNGISYQMGASVGTPVHGFPLTVGGDLNIIPRSEQNKYYYGTTANVGIGTPGVDFHVGLSQTSTWEATRFNIFRLADALFIHVREW